MQSRSQGELGVVAVVPTSFLCQAVDELGRIGPKRRDVPSVPCYSLGQRTICSQVEVGWDALTQSLETQGELACVLVEDGYGHHGVDLSQVHVAVPSAHRVQLRIVSSLEHRSQIGDLRCGPSVVQQQYLRRWSEHGPCPAGLQLVLVATSGEPLKSGPRVQDGHGRGGVAGIAGEVPEKSLNVGRVGIVPLAVGLRVVR